MVDQLIEVCKFMLHEIRDVEKNHGESTEITKIINQITKAAHEIDILDMMLKEYERSHENVEI